MRLDFTCILYHRDGGDRYEETVVYDKQKRMEQECQERVFHYVDDVWRIHGRWIDMAALRKKLLDRHIRTVLLYRICGDVCGICWRNPISVQS